MTHTQQQRNAITRHEMPIVLIEPSLAGDNNAREAMIEPKPAQHSSVPGVAFLELAFHARRSHQSVEWCKSFKGPAEGESQHNIALPGPHDECVKQRPAKDVGFMRLASLGLRGLFLTLLAFHAFREGTPFPSQLPAACYSSTSPRHGLGAEREQSRAVIAGWLEESKLNAIARPWKSQDTNGQDTDDTGCRAQSSARGQ
ncbi:hypothetical protein CCHR01_12938 [Colletotrichum chrysophilum]|uniref:Uncharacterized protein n=1 Tax=Colletotrichum chrysophilum TaxID=1836956 RepID=A0AAD9AAD3_9PEZI|nr:hypothetical protein CCHR01_12938 [Colletotrichum chrysophilum]